MTSLNYYQLIRKELSNQESPLAAKLLQDWVIPYPDLDQLLSIYLANKLADSFFDKAALNHLFINTLKKYPDLLELLKADMEAHFQRDFACRYYHEIFFFARGFLGLSAFRMAAAIHQEGDPLMAKYLQGRIAERWGLDIHPAAQIGKRVILDHAMGIVIGSTARIGDDVFIFQHVTLGSTGKEAGDRHPKIGNHVLIGAGATLLGNIKIGEGANVAAGAVVLNDVAAGTTVAGIPAKRKGNANPVL